MSVSDLEKEILAAGEEVRALAHRGALEARKSNLLADLAEIEAELAKYAQEAEAVVEKVTKRGRKAADPAPEAPAEAPAAEEAPAPEADAKPEA